MKETVQCVIILQGLIITDGDETVAQSLIDHPSIQHYNYHLPYLYRGVESVLYHIYQNVEDLLGSTR